MKKYHSPKDYQDAAKSELTSASELAYLAESEYDFVKLAVINNSNVTEEILDLMIPNSFNSWNAQEISAALAENPKTSADTLKKIAEKIIPYLNGARNNDMASKAGVNLFRHPKTPISSFEQILKSADISVLFRRKVARETNRKEALDLLLKDKSEAVGKRAAKNMELNFASPQ